MKKPAPNVVEMPTKKKTTRTAKRKTFTLRNTSKTFLTTAHRDIAEHVAKCLLYNQKSVSMIDNATGRVVARWNYGHREK